MEERNAAGDKDFRIVRQAASAAATLAETIQRLSREAGALWASRLAVSE